MYTVYDEGFKEDGAVVGFTGEFVDHTFRRGQRALQFALWTRRGETMSRDDKREGRLIARAWCSGAKSRRGGREGLYSNILKYRDFCCDSRP